MPDQVRKTDIVEIDGKLDRLMDNLEVMKESQEKIEDNIAKIKEAVYNPDQGLYARIRALETWKEQVSRVVWAVTTSVIGLTVAAIWQMFFV